VSDDCTLVSSKTVDGYRTVRASHGVAEGAWYFEVVLRRAQTEKSALRVGWTSKKADLKFPVGHNTSSSSFSIRTIDGARMAGGWRHDYGEPFSTWGRTVDTDVRRSQAFDLGIGWDAPNGLAKSSKDRNREGDGQEDGAVDDLQGGDVIGCLIRLPGVPRGRVEAYAQTCSEVQAIVEAGRTAATAAKGQIPLAACDAGTTSSAGPTAAEPTSLKEGGALTEALRRGAMAAARAAANAQASAAGAAEALLPCLLRLPRTPAGETSATAGGNSKFAAGGNPAGGSPPAAGEENAPLRNVPERPRPPVGEIRFFKNGRSFGRAFADVVPGRRYIPTISLYMGAVARARFGPFFAYAAEAAAEAEAAAASEDDPVQSRSALLLPVSAAADDFRRSLGSAVAV
jgi:hypothetical protein